MSGSARLRLSMACWNYDRTSTLSSGRVVPDGIELNIQNLEVEEIFFRMLRHREFDVAELSLSSYCVGLARGDEHFVAIPIFPSRFFRHSSIFVSEVSGIREPKDLIGRRVGVPEYQMTAPVWIRGILQDEYQIDPWAVDYFTGGEEEPGREEKIKLALPEKFKVHPIGQDLTLSKMLADGEIDALYSARIPSTFYSESAKVRRLFDNYVDIEKRYFATHHIFPIMHVIVIRRSVYEANRWIARSLYKAFCEAKRLAQEELRVAASLKTMLPWQIAAVEETTKTMGEDWWPYGFNRNRFVIDTFLRYHHEQGLSSERLEPEALFAGETFDEFRI
jgi:4,5-dihydroxyphthalate decarboxylase